MNAETKYLSESLKTILNINPVCLQRSKENGHAYFISKKNRPRMEQCRVGTRGNRAQNIAMISRLGLIYK